MSLAGKVIKLHLFFMQEGEAVIGARLRLETLDGFDLTMGFRVSGTCPVGFAPPLGNPRLAGFLVGQVTLIGSVSVHNLGSRDAASTPVTQSLLKGGHASVQGKPLCFGKCELAQGGRKDFASPGFRLKAHGLDRHERETETFHDTSAFSFSNVCARGMGSSTD